MDIMRGDLVEVVGYKKSGERKLFHRGIVTDFGAASGIAQGMIEVMILQSEVEPESVGAARSYFPTSLNRVR